MIAKPQISMLEKPAANKYGGKRGIRPTHITLHHIVGDAGHAVAEAKNPDRRMSFTFCIGSDGQIWQLLGLDEWPYTDGNAQSNRRSITIEHAGGTPSVGYTPAMYQASVRLVAWLRQEFGIPERNILTHKDVSDKPTACPGALNVDLIKRESSNVLSKGVEEMVNEGDIINVYRMAIGRDPNPNDIAAWNGKSWKDFTYDLIHRPDFAQGWKKRIDVLDKQLLDMRLMADDLAKNPKREVFDKLHAQLIVCQEGLVKMEQEAAASEKAGNAFLRWIGNLLK